MGEPPESGWTQLQLAGRLGQFDDCAEFGQVLDLVVVQGAWQFRVQVERMRCGAERVERVRPEQFGLGEQIVVQWLLKQIRQLVLNGV